MYRNKIDQEMLKRIGIIAGIVVIVIVAIVFFVNNNSTSAKLGRLGYSKVEVKTILDKLDKATVTKIMAEKYQDYLNDIISNDYFIKENLDRYVSYAKSNADATGSQVVSMVNTYNDYTAYENPNTTDVAKGPLMMVNKHYKLTVDLYSENPDNFVSLDKLAIKTGHEVQKEAYDAFAKMVAAAKKVSLNIAATGGYRDNGTQEFMYNYLVNSKGEEYALAYGFKAGFSDTQTGYNISVIDKNNQTVDFETTDVYDWMQDNAHLYGFIERYPEGKEALTGITALPDRWRFVGVEAATKIHELDITFEEYYAFYLK